MGDPRGGVGNVLDGAGLEVAIAVSAATTAAAAAAAAVPWDAESLG